LCLQDSLSLKDINKPVNDIDVDLKSRRDLKQELAHSNTQDADESVNEQKKNKTRVVDDAIERWELSTCYLMTICKGAGALIHTLRVQPR